MMVRWMCGFHLKSRTFSAQQSAGMECITYVVRRSRMRWFGHVGRKLRIDNYWIIGFQHVGVLRLME